MPRPNHEGSTPVETMERLDSDVHHLEVLMYEQKVVVSGLADRLRLLELAVTGVTKEVKIWGVILGSLIVTVIVTLFTKGR